MPSVARQAMSTNEAVYESSGDYGSIRASFRSVGAGRRLVCHPGGPGFGGQFLYDLGGLSRHCELMLLDPRGTGRTTAATFGNEYGLSVYARDVAATIQHLAKDDAPSTGLVLLGHSHGGYVVLQFAAMFPEIVEGLILVNSRLQSSIDDDAALRRTLKNVRDPLRRRRIEYALDLEDMAGASPERDRKSILRAQLELLLTGDSQRHQAFLDVAQHANVNWEAMDFFDAHISPNLDLRPIAARVTCPTLVVTGEDDPWCGRHAAQDLSKHIKAEVSVEVLPDASHFAYIDQPAGFRAAVVDYLRSLSDQ